MGACEACWTEASRRAAYSTRGVAEIYAEVLRENQPCAALCDGCDKVTTGVVATNDGRAQMCPTCLPIANAPRREVWGISYGPTAPVRVHPSEESARAAAADVTRGGQVVVFRGGNAWEPTPERDFLAEHEADRVAQRRALAIQALRDGEEAIKLCAEVECRERRSDGSDCCGRPNHG